MGFLDTLNGGQKKPAASGSSSFLSGVRQRTGRETQVAGLQQEAENAKAESDRANNPLEVAKQTVFGIPKVLQGVGKALVDDPMKTLATPVIRAEQAALTGIGMATGNQALQEAANTPLDFPSMFGGSAGTIEPQRGFNNGGAQQILGDTAKYAATVYTGAKAPTVAAKSFLGQITRAGAQGAFEGGVGGGLYMGGDALAREGSTAKDVAKDFATGAGIGFGAGGILGAGGAALARPGVLRAAAEAEAKRLRPLPVQDANPDTVYHGTSAQFDKIKGNQDGVTYVATDPAEAKAFAEDPILGGGNGSTPRVIQLSATKGKTKDVTDEVSSYVFESDPNIDYSAMTIDDVIREEAQRAREQGYRYITFEHPSSITDGDFTARVSLFPEEDLANAGPNIRRIKPLEVQNNNLRPGTQTDRPRQVPINRVQEPYTPDAELPVIKMGPKKASEELPSIQTERPKSRAKSDVEYVRIGPDDPLKVSTADFNRVYNEERDALIEAGWRRSNKLDERAELNTQKRLVNDPDIRTYTAAEVPKPSRAETSKPTLAKTPVALKKAPTGGRSFTFDHYSAQKGLKQLDPNMAGTGVMGTERRAKAQAPDLYEPTTYGYKKGEKPEGVVADNAPYKYEGKVSGKFLKIGTLRADEIARKATAYIKANAAKYGEGNSDAMNAAFRRFAKEGGYDGIIGADGKAIAMFKPADVKPSLDKMVANAFSDVQEGGGATVTIYGDRPKEGFVVAVSKATEKKIPEGKFTEKDIYKYADSLYNDLQENDAVGLWKHEGDVYMDVVRVFEDEASAARHAITNDQIAFYDLKAGKEINTGEAGARLGIQKRSEPGAVSGEARRAGEGSRANQVKTGTPVTMDIPKRTASVPVSTPKAGQAITKAKAATDVNRKLAEAGFDQLDEDTLPGIASINKEDQLEKVARLLEDVEGSKAMAYGEKPVPDGVAPQVLFNAVKNRAVAEADGEALSRLAHSKIATERSQAAQTLGSAGFNNDPVDAVRAIQEIEGDRVKAATRRRQSADIKKEAKAGDAMIEKASAKKTWDEVVDSLTC